MSIIEDIENIIKKHLTNQPYNIKCSKCGEDLNIYDFAMDDDLDISVDVDPCECAKENL
jgi:hypothetical protein